MLFSVVVPVYKSEKYLKQCVDSILKQTYRHFELILVDDGSPDQSPIMCDEFAANDNRVKVIHKKNGGAVSARLAGAEQASGEYIVTVDSDDYIDSELLESLFNAIEKNPCEIILYNATMFSEDKCSPMTHNLPEGIYTGRELDLVRENFMCDLKRHSLNFGNILFSLWSKAIKRTLFLEYQRKAPQNVTKGEDLVVFAPILYACNSVSVVNKTCYYYRSNTLSMMHKFSYEDLVSLAALKEYLMPYCRHKYLLNLERCVIQMMLEHIIGIVQSSKSYKTFKVEIKKILVEPLATFINTATVSDLRLLDKIKISSLKRKSWLLYLYYKYFKFMI